MIDAGVAEGKLRELLSSKGYELRPLDENHYRDHASFSCGRDPNMDTWLEEHALKWHEERICQVWVLSQEADPDYVLGFFALSASTIVPTQIARTHKADKDQHKPWLNALQVPFPAMLLGKFAVSEECQGKGVGNILMLSVFVKHCSAAAITGVKMLTLEAKKPDLVSYYKERYSFSPSATSGDKSSVLMYLATKSIYRYLEQMFTS